MCQDIDLLRPQGRWSLLLKWFFHVSVIIDVHYDVDKVGNTALSRSKSAFLPFHFPDLSVLEKHPTRWVTIYCNRTFLFKVGHIYQPFR